MDLTTVLVIVVETFCPVYIAGHPAAVERKGHCVSQYSGYKGDVDVN